MRRVDIMHEVGVSGLICVAASVLKHGLTLSHAVMITAELVYGYVSSEVLLHVVQKAALE